MYYEGQGILALCTVHLFCTGGRLTLFSWFAITVICTGARVKSGVLLPWLGSSFITITMHANSVHVYYAWIQLNHVRVTSSKRASHGILRSHWSGVNCTRLRYGLPSVITLHTAPTNSNILKLASVLWWFTCRFSSSLYFSCLLPLLLIIFYMYFALDMPSFFIILIA